MSSIEAVIMENLDDLVDPVDRVVDPTNAACDALMIAAAEDDGNTIDLMFEDASPGDWNDFLADMMRAFSGAMGHDEFFIKYDSYYTKGKSILMDDLDSKIWNSYVDASGDYAHTDPYDYNGVKREDFV